MFIEKKKDFMEKMYMTHTNCIDSPKLMLNLTQFRIVSSVQYALPLELKILVSNFP